jgi:hypothetical protein
VTTRFRRLLSDLGDTFWLVPALMVLGGVLTGSALCVIVPLHLASGVAKRDGKVVLVTPAIDLRRLARCNVSYNPPECAWAK